MNSKLGTIQFPEVIFNVILKLIFRPLLTQHRTNTWYTLCVW